MEQTQLHILMLIGLYKFSNMHLKLSRLKWTNELSLYVFSKHPKGTQQQKLPVEGLLHLFTAVQDTALLTDLLKKCVNSSVMCKTVKISVTTAFYLSLNNSNKTHLSYL